MRRTATLFERLDRLDRWTSRHRFKLALWAACLTLLAIALMALAAVTECRWIAGLSVATGALAFLSLAAAVRHGTGAQGSGGGGPV